MPGKQCRIVKVPDNLAGGVFRRRKMSAIALCLSVNRQSPIPLFVVPAQAGTHLAP